MSEIEQESGHNPEHFDRRSALKKAAAAGAAAGLVWSAPKIEGLTLRPNYAAAQSGAASMICFDIPAAPGAGGSTNVICPGAGPNGSQQGSFRYNYQLFNNNANIQIQVRTPFGDAMADQVTFNPASFLPGGLTGGGAQGFNAQGTPALLNVPTEVCVSWNCS